MQLEFEHGEISIFHVLGKNDSLRSNNWDVHSKDRIGSLMNVVGLNDEELKNIRRKLKKLGCISVETATTHSDFVDIGFRRVDMGMYSYRIYSRPMNAKRKRNMMRTRCSFPIPTELYSNMAEVLSALKHSVKKSRKSS